METTVATCELCDTYSTLFLVMYFALVAVIVSDVFAGQGCERKQKSAWSKDAGAGPEVKDGKPTSQVTKDKN